MSNNQQGDYLPPNAVVRQKNPRVKIKNAFWLFLRPYFYIGAGGGAVVGIGGYFAARAANSAQWPSGSIEVLNQLAAGGALVGIISAFFLIYFWFCPWPMRGARKVLDPDEYSQLLYVVRHWDRLVNQLFEEIRDPQGNYLFPGVSRVGDVDFEQAFLELSLPNQRPPSGRQSYLENACSELKNRFNWISVKPDSRTYDNGKRARLLIICEDATEQERAWLAKEYGLEND